jgi:RNA polymerase sigma factor (sigma-70 family)
LLAQLTEEQRAVFIHRQIDELSVAETAELLGKKEGAVKMALLRALEKLGALAEEAERQEKEEVAASV